MSYLNKLNKALLGALFLFISYSVVGQGGIIDKEFSTGFKVNIFSDANAQPLIENLNDSTLIYSLYKAGSNNISDRVLYYLINKQDLSIRDSIIVFQPDSLIDFFIFNGFPVSFGAKFVTDKKWPNNKLYFESYTAADFTLNITFKRTINEIRPDSTILFSISEQNRFLSSNPFIYDSNIYTFTGNLAYDTAFLSRYDLQGNLLKRKVLTFNFADTTILIYPAAYGPTTVSPLNDSLIVFGSLVSEIQFVNRFTLDKVSAIRLDDKQDIAIAANEGWMSKSLRGFLLDSNSITFYGNLGKANSFGLTEFWQFYRMTIDLQGNILDKIHLGNTTIDNKGVNYQKINDDEFFVGSTPFQTVSGFSQEYRQLLIFKVTPFSRDSILIYGQSNHFAQGEMFLDNRGDMYISSIYSNAWSDDSVFTVITKVPSNLLVSIKEYNPEVSSVVVYPNPTKDQLRVDGAEVNEFYRIISLKGQLVLEGTLTNSKTINVGSLKTGTYFLQLESQRGATYRANVFIKE